MNISVKKLENIFLVLCHLSLLFWIIQINKEVYRQIAIACFSLYLIAFILDCKQIITKSKPVKGKYFRYRRTFIGLDFYWLIPLQIFFAVQDFQNMDLIIMLILITIWITIFIKGVIRQISGDFYVLLNDDSILINENYKNKVKIEDIIQVVKEDNRYRFKINKNKATLILFNRISSADKADFKASLDEFINRNNIKTVYNNV